MSNRSSQVEDVIYHFFNREVINGKEDPSATARISALFYLAAADASVACWEAKYTYNFWRPQPAIRGGDLDSNDRTEADGTWEPLFATPPHPEYPSAHTTNSGAMAAILGLLFGDNPGVPIVVTISGITRQWSRFSEGVEEVVSSAASSRGCVICNHDKRNSVSWDEV